MKRNDITRGIVFQRVFTYTILRWILTLPLLLITGYRFKYRPVKAKTFLLLSNHTTNVEPMLEVLTLRRHFRFVASANLLQGFPGCFIRWLAAPLPRPKGASADHMIELMKANLKAGISVGMYPEGNTSWDGRTGFISRRTAELVKESGVALVTFRIEGAYLMKARWARHKRRGPWQGGMVAEYSPEQLRDMSVDQIYEIIKKDLYTNAYEVSHAHGWRYTGKNRAEGIEAVLYHCPCCKGFGTLKAEGDNLRCSCGASWTYDDYGYLNGSDGSRLSIPQWWDIEKQYVADNASALAQQTHTPIYNGGLKAYGDRLELEGEKYYYKDISKMSVFRADTLFFTCNGQYKSYSAPAGESVGPVYPILWRYLTGKEYI